MPRQISIPIHEPCLAWVVLALLGAYHGLNPAMGWLFALAIGLQEKRRSAVPSRPTMLVVLRPTAPGNERIRRDADALPQTPRW